MGLDYFEQYLRAVSLKREKIQSYDSYPFNIPAVKNLGTLALHPNMTFFVGENGTGKSTLLEAIAVHFGFNPEGGSRNFRFETFQSHSSLSQAITLVKGVKPVKDGYFLRAESFYNVASYIEEIDAAPAAAPPIKDSYGGSLHERSHGESFFALLNQRLSGRGLYLFDEPEAALSPQRQLAMLCRLDQLVKQDAQFIITTHSPILMAYPNSVIYQFSEEGIKQVAYEETENYIITKRFLNGYRTMLQDLLE